MSGIAALKGERKGRDSKLARIVQKIGHRGKHSVCFELDNCILAELSASAPNSEQDSELKIIMDGRPFYKGEKISRQDIIQLYKAEGPDFSGKLEGSFAIVLAGNKDFFVARDLYGTKPLYYCINDDGMFFASEIKALANLDGSLGIFPPGYYCDGSGQLKQFRSKPVPAPSNGFTIQEAARTLNKLLTTVVGNALCSNNNVGALLSGGLDSSAVVAACKASEKDIPTFAVGLKDSADIINARKVSAYLDTNHHEYLYTPDEILEIIPDVIYHLESFDVELVNSSAANYLAARLASETGADTILSGEGADELFAGYHYLKKHRNMLNQKLMELMNGLHNGGLQRVDRMTQAYSLECIMPFMDAEIIDFANTLPAGYKISDTGTEKWVLREAFSDELPYEVAWRTKAQFGIGTGNENMMKELIAGMVSDHEFCAERNKYGFEFKNKEEYYYYKIFKDFFPEKAVEQTVNRWLV